MATPDVDEIYRTPHLQELRARSLGGSIPISRQILGVTEAMLLISHNRVENVL